TTCIIFLPVVFMQTITGLIFKQLALVVVFSLLCSLVVSLTLVPMLCSKFLTVKPDDDTTKKQGRFKRAFSNIEKRYSQIVEKVLGQRRKVFGITAILIVSSFFLVFIIPVELAPQT